MKRSLAVAVTMLVLAGSSMVWADAASPSLISHKPKHHHKKPKNELNPQPLPPRIAPGTNPGSGAPKGDKSTAQ